MPADYRKIREENIARYGWDTAVLDLLGQLYSERTHFIFELIQNAEDAGATELAFDLFEDRLELRHDGRPFTEADVRGVCGVGQSGKAADLTAIGKFGIGFKSVYAYTRTPRIHSGGEHFRIENFVRPVAEAAIAEAGAGTLFVFPFDHDAVPAEVATREIAAALGALQPRILLFLRNIGRLRTGGPGAEDSVAEPSVMERSVAERPRGGLSDARAPEDTERPRGGLSDARAPEDTERPRGGLSDARAPEDTERPRGGLSDARAPEDTAGPAASRRVTVARNGQREEWLTWQRPVEGHPGQRVEVAFALVSGRVLAMESSPLTVFFPTEKETFLGFLIQGPYRTTPARDNVPGDDPSNQALVRQTAALLAGALPELRDEGLLETGALQALPLDAARFPAGSMFRPLFDATGDALTAEPLIPAAGGGYAVAVDLLLAGSPEVLGLLDPGQLGALCGAGRPVWFADAAISERRTPMLWRYLRDEIGLDEVTPETVVTRVTEEFLEDQDDLWITRFYRFLAGYPSLWPAAGVKPVIRLEDGRQVAPLDIGGRPAVYLPGPAPSSLPTVKRAVADSPAARPFLAALQLTVPDVVAEVLEIVLPRYDGLDLATLDPAQHDADLERVARALDEAAAGRRAELLESVKATPFLIGENAATGEQALRLPPRLYQRTKDLERYFEGNHEAWFARDGYGPWLIQLRAMGVRQAVEVRARTPNAAGYVMIAVEFGRNERGLDGFDPDAEIDGLGLALAHPSHARSEYVWNVLLAPNRRLVAGVVERSALASFSDSGLEDVRSRIGEAAVREAWVPGRDGAFHRPGELSLDDLPPTYTRDDGLAQALGMLRPVVSEAARQLGVPAEVLWGLSERPDLVAMIERELGGPQP